MSQFDLDFTEHSDGTCSVLASPAFGKPWLLEVRTVTPASMFYLEDDDIPPYWQVSDKNSPDKPLVEIEDRFEALTWMLNRAQDYLSAYSESRSVS